MDRYELREVRGELVSAIVRNWLGRRDEAHGSKQMGDFLLVH